MKKENEADVCQEFDLVNYDPNDLEEQNQCCYRVWTERMENKAI